MCTCQRQGLFLEFQVLQLGQDVRLQLLDLCTGSSGVCTVKFRASVTYTCTCRPVGKGRDTHCKALMSGPQANHLQSHPRQGPQAYKAMHTQGDHFPILEQLGAQVNGAVGLSLRVSPPQALHCKWWPGPGAPTRAQWPEHSRVADRCCCTLPGVTAWCTSGLVAGHRRNHAMVCSRCASQ